MIALVAFVLLQAGDDFEQVEVEAVQLPLEQGLARMDAFIAQHPGHAEIARALLWEAQQRITQEHFDDARALLDRAQQSKPDADLGFDLALTRADSFALERRFTDAALAYESLNAPPGSRWALQASLRGAAMRGESARHGVMNVVAAICALLIGARVVRRRRVLWPPPEEVMWSAPVLLALCLAALTRPATERTAVLVVCLGGLGLLWLTGADLRQRTLRRWARLGELLQAVFLTASLLFCAIVVSDLWARVADTFAAGTE